MKGAIFRPCKHRSSIFIPLLIDYKNHGSSSYAAGFKDASTAAVFTVTLIMSKKGLHTAPMEGLHAASLEEPCITVFEGMHTAS